MAKKPTAAQRKVLVAMRDGGDAMSAKIARRIHMLGFIHCYWRTAEHRKYTLTNLGRAAIKQPE